MASASNTFARIGSVRPPAGSPARVRTAVVLGGSIAGLLAARVLTEHADTVVVLERDASPSGGETRHGVPQGGQLHALLPGGARHLERWFPGFTDDAVASGAVPATPEQRRNYLDGIRVARGSGEVLLTASRPFLEERIRRRVLRLPNVAAVTGRATGLRFDAGAVTAVEYESRGAAMVQEADLVVDAMGRSSRLGDWLEPAGWDRPPMTRQPTGINYATALFRRTPGTPAFNAVQALCSPEAGGDLAGAALVAIEHDRWIVLLGGYGDSRPGNTPQDMVRRCRQEFPAEFGMVAQNDLLDLATYRQGDSRRRDFHRARRLPARLVAVGDAAASFNPIYGQGMSMAALHASALSMYLRSGASLDTPARQFFALQKVIVDAAWGLSTSGDLARPSVTAVRPRGYRLTHWLSNQIIAATITDARVAEVFFEVSFMLRHPAELAKPGILLRALRARRRPLPAPASPLDPSSPDGQPAGHREL